MGHKNHQPKDRKHSRHRRPKGPHRTGHKDGGDKPLTPPAPVGDYGAGYAVRGIKGTDGMGTNVTDPPNAHLPGPPVG